MLEREPDAQRPTVHAKTFREPLLQLVIWISALEQHELGVADHVRERGHVHDQTGRPLGYGRADDRLLALPVLDARSQSDRGAELHARELARSPGDENGYVHVGVARPVNGRQRQPLIITRSVVSPKLP